MRKTVPVVVLFIISIFSVEIFAQGRDGHDYMPPADKEMPDQNDEKANPEPGLPVETSSTQREADWLALKANCYDKETLGPDAASAKDLRMMLLAVRTLHPLVADIEMPPPLMRDTAIRMTVEGVAEFPTEITDLLEKASSSTIQFSEREEDPVTLFIFFGRLLHVPTILEKVSASPRVKDAREDVEESEQPNIFHENVTAEKASADVWHLCFMKSEGDLEMTTYHYFYFTVTLDRAALGAEIQPAVVGHGMKIEKFDEYHETIGTDGTVQKWGVKPW